MAINDVRNLFTGFSTIGTALSKNWTYYDVELIKRDLLNHFNTRVCERRMRPDYGCLIWDYMMEPLTSGMVDLISTEAIRICQSDPRVVVKSVNVYRLDAGVRVDMTLFYEPLNVADTFYVDFENRQVNGY
jgi:phage baseplate assembly protein W